MDPFTAPRQAVETVHFQAIFNAIWALIMSLETFWIHSEENGRFFHSVYTIQYIVHFDAPHPPPHLWKAFFSQAYFKMRSKAKPLMHKRDSDTYFKVLLEGEN